jgi:hypothetical protein
VNGRGLCTRRHEPNDPTLDIGGLMEPLMCPQCTTGKMQLPVRKPGTMDPASYTSDGGAKLVCSKCGHHASSKQIREGKESG